MTRPTTNRPTEPGWYWVRLPTGYILACNARIDSQWHVIEVSEHEASPWVGKVYPSDPISKFWVNNIPLSDSNWNGAEWCGPIDNPTAPDDPYLSQLRKAGSVLAQVANEAFCCLDNRNSPLRHRLSDAVNGWIVTVDASPKSRSDA